MRKFRKTFLYLLIILLLICSGSLLFVKTYEKEIKQKVVAQVSKYFLTEIEMKDISLSLFRKFPRITIVIKGFTAGELPSGSNQKVVRAGKIYMTMNIMNFIHKKYIIESIDIADLNLNIKLYSNGRNNFEIWKSPEQQPKSTEEPFSFDLNKIRVNGIGLIFEDFKSEIRLESVVEKLDFKGRFSDKNSRISASLKSEILKFSINNRILFKNYSFDARSSVTINNSNGEIGFTNSSFDLNDASFNFSGTVRQNSKLKSTGFDLKIESNEFELADLLKLIPEKLQAQYKNFECAGLIALDATVKGNYSLNSTPGINIDFKLNNGRFSDKSQSIELKNINLAGSFTNGDRHLPKTSRLEIKELSASLFDKKIQGYFSIENLDDPYLHIKTSADINLGDFQKLVNIAGIREAKGSAILHAELEGNYRDLKAGKTENATVEGKLILTDASIRPDSAGLAYEKLYGHFELSGNDLIISDFSGKIGKTDFSLGGHASNFISWIFSENQKLTVKARFKSKYIDMNQLVPEDDKAQSGKKKPTQTDNIILPSNTDLFFDVNCDALLYGKFIGKNIRGKFKLINRVAYLDSLFFNSAGGSMVMSGKMEHKNDHYFVSGFATADNIDITNLFFIFNNFDQHFITDKYLKGRISGEIRINISFDNDFVIDEDKLYVIADLNVVKGELVNFEPLINLMGFMKMKKMKDVVFDRIENVLVIKNRTIYIPSMTMNSNAFSIAVAGEHTFDNDMKYKLRVNLKSLFFGKNNRNRTEYTEGEDDQKGGLNLYVIMYGNGYNINYKFDKVAMRDKFKNNYDQQKKEVKEILKKQERSGEGEFEFKWEEE